jgi:hypothetical protein
MEGVKSQGAGVYVAMSSNSSRYKRWLVFIFFLIVS